MMNYYSDQPDPLIDENNDLKKALKQLQNTLDRTVEDYDTMKLMYESVKNQNDQFQQDNQELQKKLQMNIAEKIEIEQHYELAIKSFKSAIEQKQQELEDVQIKFIPALDQDMLRIKLISELEMPHRLELDSKDMEISRQQSLIYDIRRQLELFKAKYESLKGEAERDIMSLKETHKMEIRDLMLEIEVMHDESKISKYDKEQNKKLKLEIEDIKSKLNLKEDLVNQLRKDLDREKEDKSKAINEMIREIDIEKQEKRKLFLDIDKLQALKTNLEEELRVFMNNASKSPIKMMKESDDYQMNSIQGTNAIETDFQRFREKEKLYKTLQIRIKDLQRQIDEERENSKKIIKKLEEELDDIKKQCYSKDQEIKRNQDDFQYTLQDEKRRYNKLNNEYQLMEKDKNEIEEKFREFKRKQYKIEKLNTIESQENEKNQINQPLENINDDADLEIDNQNQNDEIDEQGQLKQKKNYSRVRFPEVNASETINKQSKKNIDGDAKKIIVLKEKLKLANKRIALLLQEKLIREKQQGSLDNFQQTYQKSLGGNQYMDLKMDLDAKRDRLNQINQNLDQIYGKTLNPSYVTSGGINYQQGPFIPRIITYSNSISQNQQIQPLPTNYPYNE